MNCVANNKEGVDGKVRFQKEIEYNGTDLVIGGATMSNADNVRIRSILSRTTLDAQLGLIRNTYVILEQILRHDIRRYHADNVLIRSLLNRTALDSQLG